MNFSFTVRMFAPQKCISQKLNKKYYQSNISPLNGCVLIVIWSQNASFSYCPRVQTFRLHLTSVKSCVSWDFFFSPFSKFSNFPEVGSPWVLSYLAFCQDLAEEIPEWLKARSHWRQTRTSMCHRGSWMCNNTQIILQSPTGLNKIQIPPRVKWLMLCVDM